MEEKTTSEEPAIPEREETLEDTVKTEKVEQVEQAILNRIGDGRFGMGFA